MSKHQRIRDRVGLLVIQFMRERLATDPNFVIQELVDYVVPEVATPLASPLSRMRYEHILQFLRREGHFDYVAINRWMYKVTAVYDLPQPGKTRPAAVIIDVTKVTIVTGRGADKVSLHTTEDSPTPGVSDEPLMMSFNVAAGKGFHYVTEVLRIDNEYVEIIDA